MLQRPADAPEDVLASDALGVVTKRDYHDVFIPAVEQAHREGTRLPLRCRCGPRSRRLTTGALSADAMLGLATSVLDGCAVVSDRKWIRESTHPGHRRVDAVPGARPPTTTRPWPGSPR